MENWIEIKTAEDVTQEILEEAMSIYETHYAYDKHPDYDGLIERLDGLKLENGNLIDLGGNNLSPAIKYIKTVVKEVATWGRVN